MLVNLKMQNHHQTTSKETPVKITLNSRWLGQFACLNKTSDMDGGWNQDQTLNMLCKHHELIRYPFCGFLTFGKPSILRVPHLEINSCTIRWVRNPAPSTVPAGNARRIHQLTEIWNYAISKANKQSIQGDVSPLQ